MESSISNILLKGFSVLGCLLLIASASLILAAHLGYSGTYTPGVLALVVAVGVSLVAIVFLNISNHNQSLDIRSGIEQAHRLSQGEFLDDVPVSILGDELKNASDYLRMRSRELRAIGSANMSEDVELRCDSDHFGDSVRQLQEQLRYALGTHETRDRLQRSIAKLLDEVSDVSAGDLTVQAEVGPEATGEIAEAFNQMTRNLRSLIKQVKDVTMQVASAANAISDTTEQLAGGSVAQASQIGRTTSAIASMTQQVQDVSRNASLSAEVAAGSLKSARLGTQAARENIEAMRSIRRKVQETAKRIKKLGERAQEIAQITGMIDDLSDRTGLLALNASLQAAASGDSAAGFVHVAEEVERLAERSNRLTQQISTLTQSINLETNEVVASMEETIREVIDGSALADKAGRSLVEIEQVTTNLAELLRSISDSTRFQAKSAEDIQNSMSAISEVTALVEKGSKRASEDVRTLVEFSRELRQSVAPFKLPVDVQHPMNGNSERPYIN